MQNHETKGVGTATNSTRSTRRIHAAWTSDAGDFGCTQVQGGAIMFADVWKYEMSSGNFIWMQGDSMSGIIPPTYGPLGVFDSANSPGTRNIYCHWKDANNKFWIYGGGNLIQPLLRPVQFDPVLIEWAWMAEIHRLIMRAVSFLHATRE
jgi:hypothetical protein